jgi:hypothetical protein
MKNHVYNIFIFGKLSCVKMLELSNRSLGLAAFLLGLLFDPEDDGSMFLRNIGVLGWGYTVLHPGR